MNIEQFGKGATHLPDNRDFVFGATVSYDWSKPYTFDVPIIPSHQQTSSSCVGQTAMNLAKIAWYKTHGSLNDFSARYIYSTIHLPQGGAYLRDGIHKLVHFGICTNEFFPSDPQNEPHMQDDAGINSQSVIDNARTHDIYSDMAYAFLPVNIDAIAAAIRDAGSAMIGARGTNEGWATADVRPPLRGENTIWGHAFTGVAPVIRNGKKAIKFLNSWGSAWGENGYGYLNEDYFNSGSVMSPYVLTDNFTKPMVKLVILGTEQYLRGLDGKDYHIFNAATLNALHKAGILGTLTPEPVSSINYAGKDFVVLVQE